MRMVAALSQAVDAKIMRHPVQPGSDSCFGSPFRGLPPEPEESLLRHIFRIAGVTQHTPCKGLDTPEMDFHEHAAGRGITLADARDEHCIGVKSFSVGIPVRLHGRS